MQWQSRSCDDLENEVILFTLSLFRKLSESEQNIHFILELVYALIVFRLFKEYVTHFGAYLIPHSNF